MARTFHDLNNEEKQAFRIWESRFRGDMSTPEEKDEAKRQMETLLWAGPSAVVHELKAEVKSLALRVSALEAGMTFGPDALADRWAAYDQHLNRGPEITYDQPGTPPSQRTGGAGQTAEPKKADGRGRPKRRFAAEKSPAGWQILDREAGDSGEYLPDGPFKTRKDCEARAKELEGNPAATVTQPLKLQDSAECTVTEERPDGSPIDEIPFG